MERFLSVRLLATILASVGALAVAGVSAGGPKNIQISGSGQFDAGGACNEIPSQYTMVMTGDLVGCWYAHGWEVVQETPSGVYAERGTERFIGCLSDGVTCGTFDTTYKFTAKYAPDGSEIHGRCQHPITFGTGAFEGITGRVDFKDDVTTGITTYRGHLKLPNAPQVQTAANSAVNSVATSQADGC